MKTLLLLALALLCALPAAAQDEKLPMLEEWFSMTGGLEPYLSYLPSFDIARQGANALALKYKGDPTWYNRFPGDTANMFEWQSGGGWTIVQGDFNGDGIQDYMDRKFQVYRGINNNAPPEPVPVKRFTILASSSRGWVVADFNGDGYQDVLYKEYEAPDLQREFGGLILGNADFEKMQAIGLRKPLGKRDYLIGAYTTPGGKARVILYTDDFGIEAFNLVEFTVTFAGGTPDVSFTVLDKFRRDYAIGQTQPYFDYLDCGFYLDREGRNPALLASHGTADVYAVINDRFEYRYQIPRIESSFFFMPAGIDKSGQPGWGRFAKAGTGSSLLIYSGNPAYDTIPRAQLPVYCNPGNPVRTLISIGDVTGDGMPEIAAAYNNCFKIFKGGSATSVEEVLMGKFELHQNEPNPVGRDGRTVVPIALAREGRYTLTLYDGEGKRVAELFNGILPAGEVRLPLDLAGLALGSGFYTLCLSDGKAIRERGILLTK